MSTRPDASSLQLVAFLIDGTRYAVSLAAAERVLRMVAVSPFPGAPEALLGAINLHGRPLAVVDLRRRVGLAAREYDLAAHLLIVARRAAGSPSQQTRCWDPWRSRPEPWRPRRLSCRAAGR